MARTGRSFPPRPVRVQMLTPPKAAVGTASCSNTTPQTVATGAKGGWSSAGSPTFTIFSDAFNDGAIDGKWTSVSAGVTESGGRVNIPFVNASTRQIATSSIYDAKEKSLTVELVQGDTASVDYQTVIQVADSVENNVMGWTLTNSVLTPKYKISGSSDDGSPLVYNSTNHRWLRVRETVNTVIHEVSADGSSWTVVSAKRRSGSWLHSARVRLYTNSISGTPPADMIVDNLTFASTAGAVATGTPRTTAGEGVKKAWSERTAVTFTDDFADGAVNNAFWKAASGVSESGGQGVLPYSNGVTNKFATNDEWDPLDKVISVEVPTANGGDAGSTFVFAVEQSGAVFDRYGFTITGTTIAFTKREGNSNNNTTATYNASTHRWLRVYELFGVIYWDTSTDGVTWTNRRTSTRTTLSTAKTYHVIASTLGDASPPADSVIDNFLFTYYTSFVIRAVATTTTTGAKAVSGSASSRAATNVVASGVAEMEDADREGTASASNTTPRATATGVKGGSSAAACTAASRCTATGAEGSTSAVTASNTTPRATATGQKGGTSAATATNTTPRATATGQKGGQAAATASAAARTTATGTKAAASATSCTATPACTATGAEGFTAAAAASGTPRTTATGAKGGQSTAACTAAPQCAASGQEGGQAAVTASARPQATASGQKGGQSAVTCSAAPSCATTGYESSQEPATARSRPQTTATGQKNASGSASASARPRATATIADRFSGEATSSGRPTCTSSGLKGGQSAGTESAATRAAASGQKNASSSASMSARADVTGRHVQTSSGSASASASARSTSAGTKNGQSALSASESAETAASGEKVGATAARSSARGTTTAVGTRTASGAATATSSAAATASGAKDASSDASASVAAVVTATTLIVVVGPGASVSAATNVTATGARVPTVTYGTILEGAGNGRVRITRESVASDPDVAPERGRVRTVRSDPPTVEVGRVD